MLIREFWQLLVNDSWFLGVTIGGYYIRFYINYTVDLSIFLIGFIKMLQQCIIIKQIGVNYRFFLLRLLVYFYLLKLKLLDFVSILLFLSSIWLQVNMPLVIKCGNSSQTCMIYSIKLWYMWQICPKSFVISLNIASFHPSSFNSTCSRS